MSRLGVRLLVAACAAVLAFAGLGCGKQRGPTDAGAGSTGASLVKDATLPVTTKAGTVPVDRITWAVYRDVTTLDPIITGDYPEQTAVALMCESLLRQEPDGTITPGLAKSADYGDPRTLVIELRPDVKFWDGSPMTADDVVYSLERQRDTKLGGYWGAQFSSVDTIRATGPLQVTLKLKEPDYLLPGALSFTAGAIVEKRYVEAKGKTYGTPKGGAMCTGPYKLGSWATGAPVKVVRNDAYWNTAVKPLVREIDIKGVPEEATLTAGLKTGEIDGAYPLALSSLEELRRSSQVKVYEGRSYMSDAMISANFDGVLGDARVRRALSMALDRDALAQTLYAGAAIPSRALSTPGQWGYARDAFSKAWEELPDTTVKVDAAKRLVEEAGATGKTLTLVTSSELKSIDLQATAMSNAAKSVGLKVRLKSASAANYINYFIDPKLRKAVDAFFTVNLSNWADPAAFYPYIALPGGTQNYNNYDNPKVIALLRQARATEDKEERASLLIRAQKLIVDDMPWIPTVGPRTLMVLNSKLTGAVMSSSYLFAPWADQLGGIE